MTFPFELKKKPNVTKYTLSFYPIISLFSFPFLSFLMSSDKIPSLITSAQCSLMPFPSEIGLSSIPCRHLGLIRKLLGRQSRLCECIRGAPGEESIRINQLNQ